MMEWINVIVMVCSLMIVTVEYNRRRGLSTTTLSFGTKLISSTNDQFANVAPLLVILC